VATRQGVRETPALPVSPQAAYQASYTAAQRHFSECLVQGRIPETVASDNIKTLEVVFAAYAAAEQERVVFLGDHYGN
jgi:predicted dehydrogenase